MLPSLPHSQRAGLGRWNLLLERLQLLSHWASCFSCLFHPDHSLHMDKSELKTRQGGYITPWLTALKDFLFFSGKGHHPSTGFVSLQCGVLTRLSSLFSSRSPHLLSPDIWLPFISSDGCSPETEVLRYPLFLEYPSALFTFLCLINRWQGHL